MENESIPLIDEFNNLAGGEYNFTLKSASLNESADFCVIEILYKDGTLISPELKKKLEAKLKSLAPEKYKYELKFVKNYISSARITDDILKLLKKDYSSIFFKLDEVASTNKHFEIRLVIDNLSFEHAKGKKLDSVICTYLKNLYEDYDFNCELSSAEVFKEDEEKILKENYREVEVDSASLRKIEFKDVIMLIGEDISGSADYIKDKVAPEKSVTLCGKITSIKSYVMKKKLKDDGEQKPASEQPEDDKPAYERKFYKFELADFTGQITCVCFSNKDTQAKAEKLEVGSVVAVVGNIEDDSYSGGICMKVSSLGYCTLPEKQEEVIVYHEEKPFYEFVEPQPVVMYAQDNLLNFAEEKKVPAYLAGKTFVCYDFETTGLHFEAGDRIIEIGAVKIVDGKITEKFMSYVNPEMPIPPESSKISGIVDDDVKDAPKDFQVLQDFYKFTRGSIIIGYNNINFDNVFLIGQGKKCRWNFDNETDDVYRFAQKYVHGVRNYRLGTVAEKLGVTLDNAHRAVYDALATAEVFLKIAENIE